MNLYELQQLTEMSKDDKVSPEVKSAFERAISSMLGEPREDRKFKTFVKYAFVVVYLLFVTVTGIIVFSAAVGWVAVDERWLERAWATFGSGFAGLLVTEVAAAFRSGGESEKSRKGRLSAPEN